MWDVEAANNSQDVGRRMWEQPTNLTANNYDTNNYDTIIHHEEREGHEELRMEQPEFGKTPAVVARNAVTKQSRTNSPFPYPKII
jgi:hypothetical protein